jgi:hypothetical protein
MKQSISFRSGNCLGISKHGRHGSPIHGKCSDDVDVDVNRCVVLFNKISVHAQRTNLIAGMQLVR